MIWLALSLLADPVPAPPRAVDGVGRKLGALVRPTLEEHPSLGLVVGVCKGGSPKVYGFGKVTTPRGRSVPDGDTLFEIGSVTKTFTGVLLAEAVRRGEVKLDDPLSLHLPPDLTLRAHDAGEATLLDFATHRSGLPVQPPLIGLTARNGANPYADFTRDKLRDLLSNLKPKTAPGEKFVYSNLAADLVGHALAHRAKANSFDALVQERVCRPLGLADTAEALTGGQRSRLARGHAAAGKPADPWDFATLEACGGLRSTANDLLKYAAASGKAGGPLAEAFTLAQKPDRPAGDGGTRVGLFWMVAPREAGTLVWHNGGTGGYSSMLLVVPSEGLAVVVLAAAADLHGPVDRLAGEALGALSE